MILKKMEKALFFLGLFVGLSSVTEQVFAADSVEGFGDILYRMGKEVKQLKVVNLERVKSTVQIACERLETTCEKMAGNGFDKDFKKKFRSLQLLLSRLHKKYCCNKREKLSLCDVRCLRGSLRDLADEGSDNEQRIFDVVNSRICRPLLKYYGGYWERFKDLCLHPFDRISSWSSAAKTLAFAAAGVGAYSLLKSSDSRSGSSEGGMLSGWGSSFSAPNRDGVLWNAWDKCPARETIQQRFIRLDDGKIYRLEDSGVDFDKNDPRQYIVRSVPGLNQNDGYSCGFHAFWNLLRLRGYDTTAGVSPELQVALLDRAAFDKKYSEWLAFLGIRKGEWLDTFESGIQLFHYELGQDWVNIIKATSPGQSVLLKSDRSYNPAGLYLVSSDSLDGKRLSRNEYCRGRFEEMDDIVYEYYAKKMAWPWNSRMTHSGLHIIAIKIEWSDPARPNQCAAIVTSMDSFGNDTRYSQLTHSIIGMNVFGDYPS